MVMSALSTKNVHQHSLSLYVEGINPKAALRKVERKYFAYKREYSLQQRTLNVPPLEFKRRIKSSSYALRPGISSSLPTKL